jgi:hypothetical protein
MLLVPTIGTVHLKRKSESAQFACSPQRVDDTLKLALFFACH